LPLSSLLGLILSIVFIANCEEANKKEQWAIMELNWYNLIRSPPVILDTARVEVPFTLRCR